jgi:hypothetical protein
LELPHYQRMGYSLIAQKQEQGSTGGMDSN